MGRLYVTLSNGRTYTLPKVPNGLLVRRKTLLPLSELSKLELTEIGDAWTVELIRRSAKQRQKAMEGIFRTIANEGP